MSFTLDNIIDAIKKADTQIDQTLLTADAVLTDIGADSLDMMNVFVELEDVIGFIVPDEEVDELLTARQIYDYAIAKKS